MKLISEKLKSTISKKWLDLAEKMPKSKNGLFSILQALRTHQRERSEHDYESSQIPSGIEIDYLYFCMFDLFQVEDFDHLLDGILHLFPQLYSDDLSGETFSSRFRQSIKRITSSWQENVGIIAPNRNRFFGSRANRQIADLTPEVDYIEVGIHHFLPSLCAVVFGVHLTNKATQCLVELQNKHYLSDIRFKRLVPLGELAIPYSSYGPDWERKQAILEWKRHLHSKIEACLRPYLNGHFMRQYSGKTARLPVIEVYALRGVPEGKEHLEKWLNESWAWRGSLGFDFHSSDTYTDGKSLFAPQDRTTDSASVHQLLVLWEPYLRSLKDHIGPDERASVVFHTVYMLMDILPTITLLELLRTSQDNIEKLRQNVFKGTKPSWRHRIVLTPYITLNDIVLQTSMLVARTSQEFEQWQPWFRKDAQELSELEAPWKPYAKEKQTLGDDMLKFVRFRMDVLKKHAELIESWSTQYLTLRNVYTTYLLALLVLILTFVSCVGFQTIQNVFDKLGNFVNLISGMIH